MAFAATAYAGACQKSMYGVGTLTFWNNGDAAQTVEVRGRTETSFQLFPRMGHTVPEAVAGPYEVRVAGASFEAFDLEPETLQLVNLGAPTCFARADVAGKYTSGKQSARVLEVYENVRRLLIRDHIAVFPGDALPPQKPKSPYAFQRLTAVPCDKTQDPGALMTFLRDQR